jgi:glyoxylase-like metal-dependent hydrolase (beta-lactamase superfamily II)
MTPPVPYVRDMQVSYGVLQPVSPRVRHLLARNPSAFTFHGTGTYVIGHGEVAIVDAGPALTEHVDALLHALRGETITHLLVTHTHLDHSPATALVAAKCGASSYGFGPHAGGSFESGAEVEEGADTQFVPDIKLNDGDVIEGKGWTLEAVHTPGHCSNHLCYALKEENALFSGDHVMGWSTTVVSPPDGDMREYMASLMKVLVRSERRYFPTHGPSIDAPHAFVRALIEHRKGREAQVIDAMRRGASDVAVMVADVYKDVPAFLHPAAARSLLAHLIDLWQRGEARCDGQPSLHAKFQLVR